MFAEVSVLAQGTDQTRSDVNGILGSEAVLSCPNSDLVCLCPGV